MTLLRLREIKKFVERLIVNGGIFLPDYNSVQDVDLTELPASGFAAAGAPTTGSVNTGDNLVNDTDHWIMVQVDGTLSTVADHPDDSWVYLYVADEIANPWHTVDGIGLQAGSAEVHLSYQLAGLVPPGAIYIVEVQALNGVSASVHVSITDPVA